MTTIAPMWLEEFSTLQDNRTSIAANKDSGKHAFNAK